MKKDFNDIRLEMYRIIYTLQQGLGENAEIDQADLLSVFIDGIAGIYDSLQYYMDMLVRVCNPATVLYHKESNLYPEFYPLLELFRYKELDNYTKATTPIKYYREYYVGSSLELEDLAYFAEPLEELVAAGCLDYSRNTLIRALIESWLYVIQQLDFYFERLLDELKLSGESFGNIAGFAELFGYPLYQKLPFSANVLFLYSGNEVVKGKVELEDNTWELTNELHFPYYNNLAFSEKVKLISTDKRKLIVEKTCNNAVGDLILLFGVGWTKYAVITQIVRTYLYAEYTIDYTGTLPSDPNFCVRVSTIEQKSNQEVFFKTTGFNNQIVKIENCAFFPDKGIKNSLLNIQVDNRNLNYVYSVEQLSTGNYTYRLGRNGECFIIIGGVYDFDLDIKVNYVTSTVDSIKKGDYTTEQVGIRVLEDTSIEELRTFYAQDTLKETNCSREAFCKKFINEYANDLIEGYFKEDSSPDYINNILNIAMKSKTTLGATYKVKTDIPLTLYQRKNILAHYLYLYCKLPSFLQADV